MKDYKMSKATYEKIDIIRESLNTLQKFVQWENAYDML